MKLILLLVPVIPVLVSGATVVNSFDAPDTCISALAWDGTALWAVDGASQYAYRLDPDNGSVLSSFYIEDQTSVYDPVPGGATFMDGVLYVSMFYASSYGCVYRYDESGNLLGLFDVYC